MLRATIASLTLLSLVACSTPRLDATARYGQYDLDGEVGLGSSGVTASNDFSDLGLDGDSSDAGAVVDFKWGSPHLTISTQSSAYSGDGTLASDVSFDGDTIGAGSSVSSDLDLGLTTAALTFDMVPGPVELGIGFGVTLLDLDMQFVEAGTGTEVTTDEQAPIPVLAARAGFEIGSFEISGLLSGLSVDVDDFEASMFDLDISGRWNFIGGDDHLGGSLVLGWRDVDLDLEYEDDADFVNLDFGYSGPYVGLLLRF